MKKAIVVYRITSPSNKVYIGQTWNLNKRYQKYTRHNCVRQRKLYASLEKYGFANHSFEVLYEFGEDVTQEILDKVEIFYIAQYKEVLNLTEGGRGHKPSEESRKRMSDSHIGKKHTLEQRKKISESNKGKKMSPEAIAKRVASFKGYKQSEEHIKKAVLSRAGFKHTNEAKKKISENNARHNLVISAVIQLDKEGKFIKSFEDINDAVNDLNISRRIVLASLRGDKKHSKGLYFVYKNKYHNEL